MNQPAGAVLLHSDSSILEKWILEILDYCAPESHGSSWSHRFIMHEVRPDLALCFYKIDGYQSHSENIAFEQAFFIIDDFLYELDSEAPKGNYLAFVDVGNDISSDEIIGFEGIDTGLQHFGISLDEIRKIRTTIDTTGKTIWGIGPKMI